MESPFYSEQDRDEWRRNAWYSIPNPCYVENIPFDSPTLYVTAPHISIQMAMKWLREVHHIFISIQQHMDMSYVWYIYEGGTPKGCDRESHNNTYEQACEAAIRYCLENLI